MILSLNDYLAFCLFCFVTSITPGPNNLMLLNSGLTHGFRLTIAHMLGINIGFSVMLLCVSLGIAQLFAQQPWLYVLMKWVGIAYLLYLAWKIANTSTLQDHTPTSSKPLGFIGAALFQWINPKAWVVIISALSAYIPIQQDWHVVLVFALLSCVIGLPSLAVWTLFGVALKRLMQNQRRARWFHRSMAVLLVASLLPILR